MDVHTMENTFDLNQSLSNAALAGFDSDDVALQVQPQP
jgi:hypothetical protein